MVPRNTFAHVKTLLPAPGRSAPGFLELWSVNSLFESLQKEHIVIVGRAFVDGVLRAHVFVRGFVVAYCSCKLEQA